MGLLVPFLIALIAVAALVALRPRPPDSKPASLEDLSFPTAETGRPIPVIFGTVTLQSPNVVWYGDLRYSRVRSSGTTIGYKYFVGMHLIFCHSADALLQINAEEKVVWTGEITSNQSIDIDEPGLFGGRKKQGGIQGKLDIEFGGSTQSQNTYLQSVLETQDIPAFRGLTGFVLNQMYVTAITTQIKPWSAKFRSIPSAAWFPAVENINGGSSNPMHLIREGLLNQDWGMGATLADINDASFRAAAQTLYDENFGLSLAYVSQNQIEEFLQNIGSHVNGLLYVDRFDGQFHFRLYREDYTIGDLFVLNNDNCEIVKFERPSPSDLINEIVVSYRRRGATVDDSISLQDLASIEAQGSIVSQTISYPGIDNPSLAALVADRDLLQFSSPLASIRVNATRVAYQLQEGQVVRLMYTDDSLGTIDVVMRISEMDLGAPGDPEIVIDGIEDVFSLGTNTYLNDQPSQWVNPVQPAVEATDKTMLEFSYWDIINIFGAGQANALTTTTSYLQTRIGNPSVASPNYELYTALTGEQFNNVDSSGYPPTAQLVQDISELQTTIEIVATNLISADIEDIQLNTYVGINSELMVLEAIDLVSVPNTITVSSRGIIDTVPRKHLANDVIYFFQNFTAIDPREYSTGQQLGVKIIVETGNDQLDIDTADVTDVTFIARQNRPYPPGNLRFNNFYFPETLNALFALSLTWVGRNRITQGIDLIAWDDVSDFVVEQGESVTVNVYGESNTLIRSESNITDKSYAYSNSDEKLDSQLFTLATTRDLVTASLAVATTNTIYSGITDPSISPANSAAFRRMTSDWAMFMLGSAMFVHYVNGITGTLTSGTLSAVDWRDRADNHIDAFDGRPDAELILSDQAGQQTGWAAIIPNITFTTVAPRSEDRTPVTIRDHRSTSDFLITMFTSETTFRFVANGQSAIKGIAYFRHSLHFISRTDLQAGTVNSTRRTIEEIYVANSQILDDATVPSGLLPTPQVESPYQDYSTISARPIWNTVAFGSMLYVTYRGYGSTSFNTAAKFLDITNLLNAHIPTVHDSWSVVTKKYTVSGNVITEVSRITDFVFSDRSNAADTEGVEWQGDQMRIINSATGAVTNTFTKFNINALACDWTNGNVYVIRRSDLALVRLDLLGVEFGTTLADPGFSTRPHFNFISISDTFVYITAGGNILQVNKDLSFSSVSLLEAARINDTFSISDMAADARPDSSLVHNLDASRAPELYDENGGTSPATPVPQLRLNTTIRSEVKTVRGSFGSVQTVDHTIQRTGHGYNHGNYHGE